MNTLTALKKVSPAGKMQSPVPESSTHDATFPIVPLEKSRLIRTVPSKVHPFFPKVRVYISIGNVEGQTRPLRPNKVSA